MAKPDEGRLTNRHYTKLADAISGPNMMTIAQGYLDIDPDNLESIRVQNLNNVQQTNMEILRRWANKPDNSGPDQRKKLAQILYEAADDAGYVNPNTIQKILGFTMAEANAVVPPATTSIPDVVPNVTSVTTDGATAPTPAPAPVQEDRELTIAMMLKLAKFYHSEEEVLTFALFGLEMKENVVEGHLKNKNSDFHAAVFQILKDWRKTQDDAKMAYQNLCKALRHSEVNTPAYIKQALQ